MAGDIAQFFGLCDGLEKSFTGTSHVAIHGGDDAEVAVSAVDPFGIARFFGGCKKCCPVDEGCLDILIEVNSPQDFQGSDAEVCVFCGER